MQLKVEGWDRVVLERDLLPVSLDEVSEGEPGMYPADGAYLTSSERGVTIRYRLVIGEETMGGRYKAELFLSASDVARLFVAVFRHHAFDKVLHFLAGWTCKGLSVRSMWRGPKGLADRHGD